jgi:hypothetical protein
MADTEMLRFFWDFTIRRVWLAAGLKNKIHQMRIKWSWTSAFTRVYYKIIQQRDEILFQFFQIITKSKKPIKHDHDTNWKPLSGSISQKLAEKLASFKIEKTFQFQEKGKKKLKKLHRW